MTKSLLFTLSLSAGWLAGTGTIHAQDSQGTNTTTTVATVSLNNYDSQKPVFYLSDGILAGTGTYVELLGGPVGGTLVPITSATAGGGPIFTLSKPGYFDDGIGIIPGVTTNAQFQLLAWQGALTYDTATIRGQSVIFQQATGSWVTNSVPPAIPTGIKLELPSSIILTSAPCALTVSVDPAASGEVMLSPLPGADGKYPFGTQVTLTANAATGFRFSHWSGDAPTANAKAGWEKINPLKGYIMDTNKTITAHFLTLPQIVTAPQEQSVDRGENATFTVQMSGTGPFTYQWRRNGANLPKGGRWSGVNEATLTIEKVVPADAGVYDVVVSNGTESITSPAANLIVMAPSGPFTLKMWKRVDHKMVVTLSGHASRKYGIESSTDLKNWKPVGIHQADDAGNVEVSDDDGETAPTKYYRAYDAKLKPTSPGHP